MTKPKASWNNPNETPLDLVWWTRLDDRWQIEVQRVNDRAGLILIFDHDNKMELVHEETVRLSFADTFGADIDDVLDWKDKAIEFVDTRPFKP